MRDSTSRGISAVITTYNEGACVEDCLRSVTWADQIVVVDLGSTDDTVEVCRKYTDSVFTHPWVPVVELVRQFGIEKAGWPWILVLDPDEVIPERLADRLTRLAADPDADGYMLPRENWMFGRRISHSGWADDEQLRFFRRGTVTWPPVVHAVPFLEGIVKSVGREHGSIRHENYRTMAQFVEKLNRYTTAEAQRLHSEGRRFHWLKLFYQPLKEFVHRYFRLGGYRGGLLGLILPLMMAFYTQVTYVKLWEIESRSSAGGEAG